MTSDPTMLVNGIATDAVRATDRGLLYGDGVFETMAADATGVRFMDRHFERLARGCQVLGLQTPSRALLEAEIAQLRAAHERCVIKIIVTRGVGGWGYTPAPDATTQTRIVQRLAAPAVTDPAVGLNCAVLATRLGTSPELAGIKHLNRLEQVLAARELMRRGLDEGLLCTVDGFVMEAVSSNLILVFGERVVTPRLENTGVQGVMRGVLMELLLQQGIEVRKEYIFVDTLTEADEIILCNSVRGVRPVGRLGETEFYERRYTHLLTGLLARNP